jgi:hypothetical protein
MEKRSFKKESILVLVGAFVTGGLIAFAWKAADVPKIPDLDRWGVYPMPGVWRKFFSASFPLLFLSFSLWRIWTVWGIGDREHHLASSYRRWDFTSYIVFTPVVIIIFFWRFFGDWYLWLGAMYIGTVIFKTILAAIFEIRKWHYSLISNHPYSRRGLFWIPAMGFGFLGAWLAFSLPTSGDEPHYLLLTHSIVNDFDLNLSNNLVQKDYLRFSWLGFPFHYLATYPDGDVYSIGYNGIFLFILSPGYALLGRLGAVLTTAIISALMVKEAAQLTLDITESPRAAWITWLIVGLTPPVVYFSQQVYPEALAGLLIIIFLRRWVKGDPYLLKWGIVIALALVATKIRFLALSGGIIILLFFRLKTIRGKTLLFLGSISFMVFLFWFDRYILDGLLIYRQSLITGPVFPQLVPNKMTGKAVLGLLFDQEFGLIPYMPLYIAGLIGIAWFFRRYPRTLLAFLVASGGYLYLLVTYQSPLWYGGWSTPSRYIAGIAPLLGIVAGVTLSVWKRRVAQVIGVIVGVIVGIQVLILTVNPIYRYGLNNGKAVLFDKIQRVTGADIARLFPSIVNPTFEGNLVLFAIILLIIVLAVVMLFRNPKVRTPSEPLRTTTTSWKSSVVIGLILLGIISFTIIGIGRFLPTRVIQAEAMQSQNWSHFVDNRINVSILRKGASLSSDIIVGSNILEFIVFAGGISTDGEAPVLGLYIDNIRVGERGIESGKNDWVEGTYRFFTEVPRRHVRLSVALENGQEGNNIFRAVYVDRIEIQPRTPEHSK